MTAAVTDVRPSFGPSGRPAGDRRKARGHGATWAVSLSCFTLIQYIRYKTNEA